MRRVGIVPLALSMVMVASAAEASRMDFQAGGRGAIVWDGADDVSTMNEDCDPGACFTSLFAPDLGLLFVPDTLNTVTVTEGPYMTLTVDGAAPAACATSAFCMTLDQYAELIDVSFWESRLLDPNGQVSFEDNLQLIIRLSTVASAQDPNFFQLSAASLAFLATIDPAVLATWHVGFDAAFNVPEPTSYSMEVIARPASVPEPGTLALLAMGLAGVAVRQRSRFGLRSDRA